MVSVIVPVGSGDLAFQDLMGDLIFLREDDEVIFVSTEEAAKGFQNLVESKRVLAKVRWVKSKPGRAKQMNLGAQLAKNPFLWFLHCDSRADERVIISLKQAIKAHSKSVLFFNLKFLSDGPKQMRINQLGTLFRSRILRLPFGDQGFCVHKEIFPSLGGFNESVPYGEDHLFVWQAHKNRIPLVCLGESLYTSARKYQALGWSRATIQHLYLTIKQALPQLVILIESRVNGD